MGARYYKVKTMEEAKILVDKLNKKQSKKNWFINIAVFSNRNGGYTVKEG